MFAELIHEIKIWWLGESFSTNEMEEFERIESKHTRVHHDEDIYEIIRVH